MEKQLRLLRIIYIATMGGPGFFLFYAFMYSTKDNPVSVLNTIAIAICVLLVPLSYYIQSIRSKRIKQDDTLISKYTVYHTTKIMQWSFLEAASFINGIAYFLSGSMINAVLAAAMIGFIFLMPPRFIEFKERFHVGDSDLLEMDSS